MRSRSRARGQLAHSSLAVLLRRELAYANKKALYLQKCGRDYVTQPVAEAAKKEWRRPMLRKLPVAETSSKAKGNEGQGGGKGENILVS
jgi:hypothetical protein